MASHQNAAKRLKALLRRTHFPVARLRQIPGAPAPAPANSGLGAGGGGNPWDGIVAGDPRAALIVLHWTLLDMSPLFASHLLDRDYAGLHSLTDFKFVSRSFRMLREEFNSRPQLTAEQFLTSGFAEVKMRLLADIVELIMRTHHSLAQQKGSKTHNNANSSSSTSHVPSLQVASTGAGNMPLTGVGGGWTTKSDGGGSGTSSPWNAPTPPPQQHSRPASVESRGSGGGFSAAPPVPTQPRSPPLLCGGPIRAGGSGGAIVMHPKASSPSGLSDEQNAPPGGVAHRRVPLRAPASVRAPVPLDQHDWRAADPGPLFYNGGGGGSGAAGGGGGGSSVWVRGPGSGCGGSRGAVPQPTERSPLRPRSAQGPPHEHTVSVDLEAAATSMGMLPPPAMGSGSGAGAGAGRSDWLAVQQAFGSPSALHMPLPPPVVVPSSPPTVSPMPKLPPRSASSVAAAAAVAAAHEAAVCGQSEMVGVAGGGVNNGRDRVGFAPVGRGGGVGGGGGSFQQYRKQDQDDDASLKVELGKMQRQIEAMLERHSRSLEGRMSETEEILSARLALLETKMHGLEIASPLHT